MSQSSQYLEFEGNPEKPVPFIDKFVSSDRFSELFREGMVLVEETAQYLDGEGRREGRALSGQTSLCFTTESMRLTTRLMNLASWLLLRRSYARGEISPEAARRERLKLKLDSIGRPAHVRNFDDLPPKLQQLIEQSFGLHDRIHLLDKMFDAGDAGQEAMARIPASAGAKASIDPAAIATARDATPGLRLVFSADKPAL